MGFTIGLLIASNLFTFLFMLFLNNRILKLNKTIKIYSDSREWYRQELYNLFIKCMNGEKCENEEIEAFFKNLEDERKNCMAKHKEIYGSEE